MVMAQSMFKLIKSRQPDTVIDVVAPAWTEPLLARMPEISDAIPMPLGHGQLQLRLRWQLGKGLRDRHYDQAIVLPRSLKSAIAPFAAKAKRRTGYFGELRWGLLNDIRTLDKAALPRTVDRFNHLALEPGDPLPEKTPLPRLVTATDEAEARLQALGSKRPDGPVLGLCPGAEYGPAKRWPVEYFAAVAKTMRDKGWTIWLFGSGKDVEATKVIAGQVGEGCLDLGGKTSLGEAIDLMAMCDAVVSNDSGLMHVAAATDRPLVAIYGSSDPGFTPPLNEKAKILRLGLDCSPCFKRECPLGHTRCLYDISPEQVISALQRQQAA
ncbi:MAG: lipopolysaccharide heptosyltransferase II [Proteobacteria bacterium]|nr:lipopolysaccharide heptosyltransferase II [Pseudomonadota bacterium]